MKAPYKHNVFLLCLLFQPVIAQEEMVEINSEEPLIDLLEFLGEFETANGDWIDPEDFSSATYSEFEEPTVTDEEDD